MKFDTGVGCGARHLRCTGSGDIRRDASPTQHAVQTVLEAANHVADRLANVGRDSTGDDMRGAFEFGCRCRVQVGVIACLTGCGRGFEGDWLSDDRWR